MAKGSSFEREVCRLLSKWWTYNQKDDVFWRTAGSGAMAKTRSKTNKKTFGQEGDVQATNPIGQKLIDLCTIELKRGYSKCTFADVVDKLDTAKEQMFESFILQAETDAANANAYSWLLIVRRDRRKSMVFMPYKFVKQLKQLNSSIMAQHPIVIFTMKSKENLMWRIFGISLDKFFDSVKPKHIKKIHNENQYCMAVENKKNTKEDNNKNAQRYKCINCDEYEVIWNGTDWECLACGAINDYPK